MDKKYLTQQKDWNKKDKWIKNTLHNKKNGIKKDKWI